MYLNPGNAICVSIRLSQFGKRFSVGVSALAWHTVALTNDKNPLTLGTCPVEHHPLKDTQVVPLGLNEHQTVRLRRTAIKGDGVVVFEIIHCSLLSEERGSLKLKGNSCPKTVA